MARKGVEYQEVVQVIHQLQRQGDNPTVQRIRESLGTGSFTTLSEHLRQWREDQRQATPLQQETQQLPDSLLAMTQKLWEAACLEADEKLLIYQEKADEEVRKALKEKHDALEAAQRTEERNLLLDQKNTRLLQETKDQAGQISRMEQQLEHKDSEIQARAQEARLLEKELVANKSLLAQRQEEQQQQLEKLNLQHQTALLQEQERNEANQQRWMLEVDLARQQARELQEEYQQERRNWQQQEKLLLTENQNKENARQELEKDRVQLAQLTQQQEEQLAGIQEEKHKLSQEKARVLTKLETLQQEQRGFWQKLEEKNKQIQQLEESLKQTRERHTSPLIMT